jgi:hypothetical protein
MGGAGARGGRQLWRQYLDQAWKQAPPFYFYEKKSELPTKTSIKGNYRLKTLWKKNLKKKKKNV